MNPPSRPPSHVQPTPGVTINQPPGATVVQRSMATPNMGQPQPIAATPPMIGVQSALNIVPSMFHAVLCQTADVFNSPLRHSRHGLPYTTAQLGGIIPTLHDRFQYGLDLLEIEILRAKAVHQHCLNEIREKNEADNESLQRAREEAAARKRKEEQEAEERRKKAEEEATARKKKAAEEAAAKALAARRKREEEARKKREEEERKKREEQERKKREEEEKRKREEEVRKKREKEEAEREAARIKAEAEEVAAAAVTAFSNAIVIDDDDDMQIIGNSNGEDDKLPTPSSIDFLFNDPDDEGGDMTMDLDPAAADVLKDLNSIMDFKMSDVMAAEEAVQAVTAAVAAAAAAGEGGGIKPLDEVGVESMISTTAFDEFLASLPGATGLEKENGIMETMTDEFDFDHLFDQF